VTQLPAWGDDAALKEWTIRQLDEADDEAERHFMIDIAPALPGVLKPPGMRARGLLESRGLGNFYLEPRRRPGRPCNSLPNIVDEFVLKDVKRIRALWQHHYRRQNRKSGQVSAEEIAAERHLRIGGDATDEKKLRGLVDEIHERQKRGAKSAH
jgi:hypothetical protein